MRFAWGPPFMGTLMFFMAFLAFTSFFNFLRADSRLHFRQRPCFSLTNLKGIVLLQPPPTQGTRCIDIIRDSPHLLLVCHSAIYSVCPYNRDIECNPKKDQTFALDDWDGAVSSCSRSQGNMARAWFGSLDCSCLSMPSPRGPPPQDT